MIIRVHIYSQETIEELRSSLESMRSYCSSLEEKVKQKGGGGLAVQDEGEVLARRLQEEEEDTERKERERREKEEQVCVWTLSGP